jgi:gluconolactonase
MLLPVAGCADDGATPGNSAGSSGSAGAAATGGSAGRSSSGAGGVGASGGAVSTGGAAATAGTTAHGGSSGGGAASGGAPTAGTGGGAGTTSAGMGSGGGGPGSGGMAGAGGASQSGGAGGSAGAGAGTGGSAGGGGPAAGRLNGACMSGASYSTPVLTGTPKLVSMDTGSTKGTYEGLVWLSASGTLLFSDLSFSGTINPSQVLKLTPPSTVAPYIPDSGTNGMALDAAGGVQACSHKVQGIVKLDGTTVQTVVSTIGGKHFNSPNDIVIRSDGVAYFTDPDYQLGNRTSETGKKGIYRVVSPTSVFVVDDTFNEPNGITLSPDEKVLYVSDYPANAVRSFSVAADGTTSGRKDFVTVMAPDGFAVDCLGNLYVASGTPDDMPGTGGTVEVFSPAGTKLGTITVAPKTSNVAFGGPDGKTLYISAGKALYSLDMNLPGYFY